MFIVVVISTDVINALLAILLYYVVLTRWPSSTQKYKNTNVQSKLIKYLSSLLVVGGWV
jgi:hypothetical protein